MIKKRIGMIAMVTGLLLIAAALFLVIQNIMEADAAEQASAVINEQLHQKIEEHAESPTEPLIQIDPVTKMPYETIDGNDYIGVLEIPDLDLSLPIMRDWDYAKLKIAPGVYHGSYFTDDFVLLAHNYGKHFGEISSLKLNADVFFTDVTGSVHHYLVDNIEVLDAVEIEKMIASDHWDLTLFTCTLDGMSRYAIRCILTD